MLWKERYISRTSVATKLVGGIAALVLGGLVVYSAYQFAAPAFREVLNSGYGAATTFTARYQLNIFVRFLVGSGYVVWALGVASAASSSIVYEREADTWISLIATPLEGFEIIRAKMVGAVWGTRWLGCALLILAALGMAAGAIHPIGFIVAIVETVVFVGFALALGTYVSLRSQSSGRAMTMTVGILVLLNGGYLLCCIPLRAETTFVLVGVTPALQTASLLRYDEFDVLFGLAPGTYASRNYSGWLMASMVGTFGYGFAALALTAASMARFDESVDRPRRLGQYPPPSLTLDDAGASDEAVVIGE